MTTCHDEKKQKGKMMMEREKGVTQEVSEGEILHDHLNFGNWIING